MLPLWQRYHNPISSFFNSFISRRCLIFPISRLLSSLICVRIHHYHQPHYTVYPDEQLLQLLRKCTQFRSLEALRAFHALNIQLGSFTRQKIYFANNVISLYMSFGETSNARKVFDEMSQRNAVSYNVMISGYGRNGWAEGCWEMFCGMWACGFRPTSYTFGGLLTCNGLDIRKEWIVYGLVVKNGLFYGDPYVGTSLMGLFGRHGCVDEAIRVFDDMPRKNLVTWNSIISLLGYNGFVEDSMILFRELMRLGYGVSVSTIVGLLCGLVDQDKVVLGQQVHSLMIKSGLDCEVSSSNALLNLCVRCHNLPLAERMFQYVLFRDVVTYNTMIRSLVKSEWPGRGLELLLHLKSEGILPNETTYAATIGCCANMEIPAYGEFIHGKTIKRSIESDVFVGTALINFYGKFDMLNSARRCFNETFNVNLVSWNCLIAAFSSRDHPLATTLFKEMLKRGYFPNETTLSSVLKACTLFELQQLHSFAIRIGYTENVYVSSSLISSYAKKGSVSDALRFAECIETQHSIVPTNVIAAAYNRNRQYDKSLEVLSSLDEPDIVSWNILLSTCSHNGQHYEALELLKHMLEIQIYPDNHTIASILSSCTSLRSLVLGSSVHGLLIKTNSGHCDTLVHNILIDMYAKCGSVEDAMKIFDVTADKNIITWTNAISALAHHGFAHEALKRFREMELHEIKPDNISFVAALSACRHAGLVKEGMELFARMQRWYRLEPNMDHYHGVVDLLARNGHLKEAEEVISSMPFPPNAVVWRHGVAFWRAARDGRPPCKQGSRHLPFTRTKGFREKLRDPIPHRRFAPSMSIYDLTNTPDSFVFDTIGWIYELLYYSLHPSITLKISIIDQTF